MKQQQKKTIINTLQLYGGVLIVAIIMGVVSHFLLAALAFVGNFRDQRPLILFLLPILGLITAYAYQNYGKNAAKGNNLIIESIQSETSVPLRMGFMTFIFTILSHLFGASVGREGSAVQIGGVLANKLGKFFKLSKNNQTLLVHAGVSAGFASIFGTPLAGAFFGMEMAYIGKLERKALIPCFISAFVGNYTALLMGTIHEPHAIDNLPTLNLTVILALIIASIGFGLLGRLFAEMTHFFKRFYLRTFENYLFRALISALVVVVLMVVINGQRYEGLSLWIIDDAFKGVATITDSLLKLLFTSLSLGAGFQGGEVTPLFDIGSSFGSGIANFFSLSPALFAALGMICVFGSAANAPLTTIMLGIDLFGADALPYYVVAAFISYFVSGHQGIYTAQIVVHPKTSLLTNHQGKSLAEIAQLKRSKGAIHADKI